MLLKHISLFLVFLFLVLQGCQTQPVRHLAPEDLQTDVTVLASEDFRIWAHSPEENLKKVILTSHQQQKASSLWYDKNGKHRDMHFDQNAGTGRYLPHLLDHATRRGRFQFRIHPTDFKEETSEIFDKEYMTKLYNYGYEKAKQGYPWLKEPPTID